VFITKDGRRCECWRWRSRLRLPILFYFDARQASFVQGHALALVVDGGEGRGMSPISLPLMEFTSRSIGLEPYIHLYFS